jgi:transcription elongation factor GreA
MRAPITLRGAEKLRAELRKLKGEDRPAVIRAIADARSHGDLSENAEYHAAREQQGFIEGRINEIEKRLANAQVIDPAALPAGGKVVFGATVELAPVDGGAEVRYQIVGDDRQVGRRRGGGRGTGRRAQLRDPRRAPRVTQESGRSILFNLLFFL